MMSHELSVSDTTIWRITYVHPIIQIKHLELSIMLLVVNYAPRVVNYGPRVISYAPRVINYAPREHL
jgi:hypothetical protein